MASNPFEDLLDNTEGLTPDEQAALRAEAAGAEPEKPAEPTEPAKAAEPAVEAAPAEPTAEAEPVAEPAVEPAREPKPGSAQARIRELVAERNAALQDQAAKAAEAQELRERWARLEERQQIAAQLAQQEAAKQQQQAEVRQIAIDRPDPAVDPMGAELFDTKYKLGLIEKQQQALLQHVQAQQQQTQSQVQLQALSGYIQNDLAYAKQQYPDYDAAAKYASEARVAFWEGLGVPPHVAKQRVQAEALAIAGEAFQNGQSASKVYRDLAYQWGFKPEADAKVAPKEKLAQVQRGQQVQGLGNVPNAIETGDTSIAELTAAQIADMPDEQFLKLNSDPKTGPIFRKRLQQLELG